MTSLTDICMSHAQNELWEFGLSVTEFRHHFHLKQKDIAKECLISVGTLRAIEYGKGNVSVESYMTVKWFIRKYIASHEPSDE